MFVIGLEGIVITLPLLSVRMDLPGTDLHAVARDTFDGEEVW